MEAPPADDAEQPRQAPDPKTIFLGGLFVLALLAAAYVAADILLPLVLAFILKLLLQPAMRWLETLRVPRILAALLLIVGVFGAIVGLGRPYRARPPHGQPNYQKAFPGFRSG